MTETKTEEKQEEKAEIVDTDVDSSGEDSESQEESKEEKQPEDSSEEQETEEDESEEQEKTEESETEDSEDKKTEDSSEEEEEDEVSEEDQEESNVIYVDGTYQILGRMCSKIAKNLLNGKEVNVVNCEKVVKSGKPKVVRDDFMAKVKKGDPYHGPFYPKYPDKIVRRVVRGMIPKNSTGREAFSRLKTFNGIPSPYKNKKLIKFEDMDGRDITNTNITTLEEIALHVGAKKKW